MPKTIQCHAWEFCTHNNQKLNPYRDFEEKAGKLWPDVGRWKNYSQGASLNRSEKESRMVSEKLRNLGYLQIYPVIYRISIWEAFSSFQCKISISQPLLLYAIFLLGMKIYFFWDIYKGDLWFWRYSQAFIGKRYALTLQHLWIQPSVKLRAISNTRRILRVVEFENRARIQPQLVGA